MKITFQRAPGTGLSEWRSLDGEEIPFVRFFLNEHRTRKIDPRYVAAKNVMVAGPEMLAALKAAIPCLARAINEGAFKDCAAPLVGVSALSQAEAAVALAEGKKFGV